MFITIRRAVAAAIVLGALGGCGLQTHPVEGSFQIDRGDVAVLKGSVIEAMLESDETVRATGEIGDDGRFTLETLHAGTIVKGAPPGSYKARIILNDDDRKALRVAAKAIAPRYLKFEASGLTFTVPASEKIVWKLTKT